MIFFISVAVFSALLISKTHDDFSYYHLPFTKYLTWFVLFMLGVNPILNDKNLLSNQVANSASIIAKDKEIRKIIKYFQIKNAYNPPKKYAGSVLDGRDITSVIMKDAMIKYYNKFGYDPTREQIRKIFKKNVITLDTMNKLQNDINNLQLLPSRVRKKIIKKNA